VEPQAAPSAVRQKNADHRELAAVQEADLPDEEYCSPEFVPAAAQSAHQDELAADAATEHRARQQPVSEQEARQVAAAGAVRKEPDQGAARPKESASPAVARDARAQRAWKVLPEAVEQLAEQIVELELPEQRAVPEESPEPRDATESAPKPSAAESANRAQSADAAAKRAAYSHRGLPPQLQPLWLPAQAEAPRRQPRFAPVSALAAPRASLQPSLASQLARHHE
jgi:hypothetical protein